MNNNLFFEPDGIDIDSIDIQDSGIITVKRTRSLEAIPKKITTIEDFEVLKHILAELRSEYDFLFRGHASKDWLLKPTLARLEKANYSRESEVLKEFKAYCVEQGYDRFRLDLFNEDLFYMGMGRHLGLNSRLLDWSAGICESMAFLLEDTHLKEDGLIWIIAKPKSILFENISPLKINDGQLHFLKEAYYLPSDLNPPLGEKRRWRQHGFFTAMAEKHINTSLLELIKHTNIKVLSVLVPNSAKQIFKEKDLFYVTPFLLVDQDCNDIQYVNKLNSLLVKIN